MTTYYYKRFRMEFDLTRQRVVAPELPAGYVWQPWTPGLEERHARVKALCFRDELDATVFESLGDLRGCLQLMHDIADQPGFLPQATWLLLNEEADGDSPDCGTIQAVALTETLAAIQNVGIAPGHRGHGLGRALVLKCLAGCQHAGLRRVGLEVTASNAAAVQLYQHIGFQPTRTMYRSVELAGAER